MTDLRTISEIAPLVRSGQLSPVDLVAGCLEAARERASLNAFITLMTEQAAVDAERAAAEIASGRYRGPLHGIPIAVNLAQALTQRISHTPYGPAVRPPQGATHQRKPGGWHRVAILVAGEQRRPVRPVGRRR